jgi:hypothetical protein
MKKEINIIVKKWFDKINGNTYHSIQFELNNKIIHSKRVYGYGTQYEVTFKELFKKNFKRRNFNIYEPNYLIIDDCKKEQLNIISKYTK